MCIRDSVNTAPYYRTYVNTAPYYRTYTADTSAYSTGGLPNLVAISNDGNADAYPIIPVSYTHLDVYKRQASACHGGFPCPWCGYVY